MKKIFLSFALFAAFLLNSTAQAAELLLYSQDNFEINSDAYTQDDKQFISLVRDSNLIITYTHDKDFNLEKIEPVVDLQLSRAATKEVVASLKTPSKKMTGQDQAALDAYLAANRTYFDQVVITGNKTTP